VSKVNAPPTDIDVDVESALGRVACELVQIEAALRRLETLVALIASAAVVK
jgi:hypothetical protein